MSGRPNRARRVAGGLFALLATGPLASAPASACSVCIGAKDTSAPMVAGAQLGVYLLLGVTLLMLGGLTAFFLYLRRRARQFELDGIDTEWATLQRSAAP